MKYELYSYLDFLIELRTINKLICGYSLKYETATSVKSGCQANL